MDNKGKIAIFQSDLHIGGIQHSLINLLRFLEEEGVRVDVFLFDMDHIAYDIRFKDHIRIIPCQKFPYWNRFVPFAIGRHIWKSRFQEIKDTYEVSIDFNSYWNECAIGALSIQADKYVTWNHNDVAIKSKSEMKYRILWFFFHSKWKQFDEYVCVSQGIVESLIQKAKLDKIKIKKIHVIGNLINTKEIIDQSAKGVDFKVNQETLNIVSTGRLCHQKGYDLLIEDFKKVVEKRKEIHLYLIGDGPDRSVLEEKVKTLELNQQVTFLGNQKNPFPYMKQMDAFILNSRYEGQGMVCLEAKSLGLPVIVPKHLEKYIGLEEIKGTDDITLAMKELVKQELKEDLLNQYNDKMKEAILGLLGRNQYEE